MKIGHRIIGSDAPCFIIAEAGVNHNGDLNTALELVQRAKDIGADCVKFQTFKAERVVTKNAPKAAYQLRVTDEAESQLDMLKKLELHYDDYRAIVTRAQKYGITLLSTPYNEEDADFLEGLGFDAFKIASGQLVEYSFLEYVAKKGLPIILSTGMADMKEVAMAVDTILKTGNNQLALLQCTTNYPSLVEEANVNAMITMREAFKLTAGYSDHVPENYATYCAVALGASIIEKHFTLDKNMSGPDHSSSLNPAEFSELISGIRKVELSKGDGIKRPTKIEMDNSVGMRRSIVASRDLKAGDILSYSNLTYKRPATGLAPFWIDNIIGKSIKEDIAEDSQIKLEQVEW